MPLLNAAVLPGAVGLHGGLGLTLGYRELLWKLKTKAASQHHHLQTALEHRAAQADAPRSTPRLASLIAVPVRVFKQNVVLAKLHRRWLACKGELRGAASEVRHLAVQGAAAAAGRVRPSSSSSATGAAAAGRESVARQHAALANRHASWVEMTMRPALLAALGVVCKTWMHGLNTTTVHGGDRLHAALEQRQHGQGLLTVSNHVAALDDPLMVSAVLPWQSVLRSDTLRWVLCATDRCFNHGETLASFFRAAKVLPVERGGGLAQWGLAVAENKIGGGDWVHVFPEGARSYTRSVQPCKRGVGRLLVGAVQEAEAAGHPPPLLLPMAHMGMEEVLPRGAVAPRVGQRVSVVVGEPIAVTDLLQRHAVGLLDELALYDAIAARVGEQLRVLHDHVATVHASPSPHTTVDPVQAARAARQQQQQAAAAHVYDGVAAAAAARARAVRAAATVGSRADGEVLLADDEVVMGMAGRRWAGAAAWGGFAASPMGGLLTAA